MADAQVPPPPGIYILGHDIGRDGVSATETIQPDGRPDLWMRMTLRNLGYYIGPRSGGYHVTHFILRTKAPPFRQWDTIPGNGHPLLEIIRDGRRVNRFDGSVNGYNPPGHGIFDIYIAEDTTLELRNIPMEMIVQTLDGAYRMDVSRYNIYDHKVY